MEKKYRTFREFYPFYLSEHSNRTCRRLHFAGAWLALLSLLMAVVYTPWFVLVALACGYGFAWVGHFFFEKNRPATFSYPVYSFMGDWMLFKDILTGKIPF